VAAPTTVAPTVDCNALADEYLDTFFALGAGTPRDADDTTVELPVAELLTIDREAADGGCTDFVAVACGAYAELEAQGLTVTNSEPPPDC